MSRCFSGIFNTNKILFTIKSMIYQKNYDFFISFSKDQLNRNQT